MHLSDALIDLRGNLFAEGTISFPPDPSGIFYAPQHTHVAIDRSGNYLRSAEAKRDASNGFVLPTLLLPMVQVPRAVGALLAQRIRFGSRELAHLSLPHNDGSISIGNGREQRSQHLTDWRVEITEVDGDVRIVVSAALWSTHGWPVPSTNFWPNDGEPARMIIDVVVSSATRSAIGAYVSGFGDTEPLGEADYPRTDVAHLDLAHAPVGAFSTYAIGPTDQWFSITQMDGDGRPSISFTRLDGAPSRLKSGVIGRPTYGTRADAQLFFRGLNLSTIATQLVHATSLTLRMEGRKAIGELVQDHRLFEGMSPVPEQYVVEAHFDFELDRRGLSIKYDVLVDDLHWRETPYRSGRLEAEMYLCWEVLILTEPAFLASRRLLPSGLVTGGRLPIFEDEAAF
jgi:hypothetical protein